ncbi:hypothetical protein DB347_22790 [Opitutaceae bacterium EW11]|nr:hypothetical protein DB347_22790 [Opitutaceae bacterium EW11]
MKTVQPSSMKRIQLLSGLLITCVPALAQFVAPDAFQRLTSTDAPGVSYDLGVAGKDGSFSIVKSGVGQRLVIDKDGNVTVQQGLIVNGTFSAANFNGSNLTGGASGLTLKAGGTNQNITLTPSGTGYTILNGNVGLGTVSPGARLAVDAQLAGIPAVGLVRIGSTDYSAQTNNVLLSIAPGVVNVDGPGVPGGRFKIDASGNVGINAPTPGAKLDVGGNTRIQGSLAVADTTVSSSPTTGAATVAGGLGVGGDIHTQGDLTATRIGVGTSTPGASLHVAENAVIEGVLTINGEFHVRNGEVLRDNTSDTLHITSATDATGSTDGALTVSGGVGVAKTLYAGADVNAGGTMRAGNMLVGGQQVWHAGNFNPNDFMRQSGGSVSGNLSLSGGLTGGSTGLTINAGAADQSVVLEASGTGRVEVRDVLAVTNQTGIQYLLMGNQDDTGAGNPSIIRAFNGHLQFGRGDSWLDTGGAFTTNVTFQSDGKVGIGTGSPTDKLHVQADATGRGITVDDGGVAGSDPAIAVTRGGATRLRLSAPGNVGTISGVGSGLALGGSDGAQHVFVASNGRVGVGTNAPATKMTIATSGAGDGLTVREDGTSGTAAVYLSSGSTNASARNWVAATNFDAIGSLSFRASSASNPDPLSGTGILLLAPNGNVGIGTSAPASKLHLAGTGAVDLSIQSTDGNRRWSFQTGGPSVAGRFELIDRTSNGTRMAIDVFGNVGIGTIYPNAKLEVAGNTKVSGSLTVTSNATVAGQTSTGTLAVGTDATIGRNIAVNGATNTGTLGVATDATILGSAFIPNGRLGIGLPVPPNAPLHVNGPGGIWVTGSDAGAADTGYIHLANGYYGGDYGVRIQGRDNGQTGNDLAVLTRESAGGAFVESLTVKSQGNVGIGTSTPDKRLTVAGEGAFETSVYVNRSGGGDKGLYVGSATTASGGNIQLLSSSNRWNLSNEGGALNMYVGATLHSAGMTAVSFLQNGDMTASGRVTAQQVTVTSAPVSATDAVNKNYFDENMPFLWSPATHFITAKNASDWLGLGTDTPFAPLHVINSGEFGEVARFEAGGRYANLEMRSYLRLSNQNPSYWWEFSAQDEYAGGKFNGFALRAAHAVEGVAKDLLYISPPQPVSANQRMFLRILNQNPNAGGWDLSVQGPLGDGSVNGFAIREATYDPHPEGGAKFAPSAPRIYIESGTGNVGIGTTAVGDYRLAVKGKIHAEEIVVETGWADYVFEDGYRPMPLQEVESHIKEHKHLPGIPTADEVAAKGVNVGEMQSALLAKVEELTLHLINQEKRLQKLEQENAQLRAEVSR